MPVDIKEINKLSKKYIGTHKFLAESLLSCNINKNDTVRMNMFDNHITQALVLKDPNFPNVFSNFENMIGYESTAIKQADRNWQIIKVIKKNDFNHMYILKDDDNNIECFYMRNIIIIMILFLIQLKY